jgi:hypothetical protein
MIVDYTPTVDLLGIDEAKAREQERITKIALMAKQERYSRLMSVGSDVSKIHKVCLTLNLREVSVSLGSTTSHGSCQGIWKTSLPIHRREGINNPGLGTRNGDLGKGSPSCCFRDY